MKKLYCVLIVTVAATFLSGCPGNGSSAPPPTNFVATPGDSRALLTWTASPDVNYWLFTATDLGLTAFNWTGLPNSHAYTSAVTPFYMCGLFTGTLSNGVVSPITYDFATNGRINGGPGGSSSPTITATPYNASDAANHPWTALIAPASGVPATTNLNGVGYTGLTTCSNNSTSAAGSFAVVGAGGAIYTSSDGITWSTPASPISLDLYAVTGYAANQNSPSNPAWLWVAVGATGASVYSTDGGITWTTGNASNITAQTLRSITHVAGTYTAVGDAGTILSTTDGITWTSHTSASVTAKNLNGVAHGNIYVAVGDSGTILTSVDGNTWTVQIPKNPSLTPTPITNNLHHVDYFSGSYGSLYVAVGDAGVVVTSKDGGATWITQTPITGAPNLVNVTAEYQAIYNARSDSLLGFISTMQFVAIDSSGNAYTSTNGYIWSGPFSTGAFNLNAIVSSGFGYVAVGNAGVTAYAF